MLIDRLKTKPASSEIQHSVAAVLSGFTASEARFRFSPYAIPQPAAFMALMKGYDGECPCCRRPCPEAK